MIRREEIILHAKRKWQNIISTVIRPYTVQTIAERHNWIDLNKNGQSPLKKFTGTIDDKIPTNFHTWGFPMYILDNENQSGGIGTPKWEPKSHIGIYLVHSLCRSESIYLVINLKTGMISPQFHAAYNNEFMTVPYMSSADPPLKWSQILCHSAKRSTEEQEELSYQWLHRHATGNGIITSKE